MRRLDNLRTLLATLLAATLATACTGTSNRQGRAVLPTTLERAVDSVLHCSLPIPRGMGSWKLGKDFVWMTDNGVKTMRNVCLYAYEGTELSVGQFVRKRDSVMQQNIPGEEAGMFMHTAEAVAPTGTVARKNGRTLMRVAGAWEMVGDAMGGPFVSYCQVDSARNRVVIAEAFVYAPGRQKAKVLERLEKHLLKLEINNN
mgnify:CR=1 FL=1